MNSTDERQTNEGKSTIIADDITIEDLGKRIPEEENTDSNVITSKTTDTSIQILFDDTSENATSPNSAQQDSLENINEIQSEEGRDPTNTDEPYQNLALGLIMTLAFRLCGNVRTAAITAIVLTIFVSSFDTSSDLFLTIFYLSQGLTTLSVLVLLCDYFPGIAVLAHHMSSDSWNNSTIKEKTYAILALACQPFSLLITNIVWFLDVSNKHNHRLARLSTVLHGCLEAPMQFIILLYAQSKGIIPLPWMQSISVMDSNDNVLYLSLIHI